MWVPYKLRLWAFLLRERLNKGKYPRLMIADDLPEDHKFPFENGERVLVLCSSPGMAKWDTASTNTTSVSPQTTNCSRGRRMGRGSAY